MNQINHREGQEFLSDKVARVSNAMDNGILIYESTGKCVYLTSGEAQNLCDFLVGKYDLTY